MRHFACEACGRTAFFENLFCGGCGASLGFAPARLAMLAAAGDPPAWRVQGVVLQPCANRNSAAACNWLLDDEHASGLCRCCRLNGTIPDLAEPANGPAWQRIERAKRRLAYGLLRLGLDLEPKRDAGDALGLRVDVLAQLPGAPPVVTGHVGGVVTLNLAEADDVQRESARVAFDEPLRTLLGHLRHEASHYLHHRWIAGDEAALARWRELFGDERADYAQALLSHHAEGPPADWAVRHVSAYASAHPHEDWAETCAHLLLIDDALETAGAWGLQLDSQAASARPMAADGPAEDLRRVLLEQWLPAAQFLNAMNRSLGLRDGYPFLLSNAVIDKLVGALALLRGAAART